MVKMADLRTVALVAIGVMVAGYAMYALRDVDVVDNARQGFDKGVL